MPVLNDMLRGYKHQLNLLMSRNSNLQYIYHFTASGKESKIPTDINHFWKRSAKPFPPKDFIKELKEPTRLS
jgi:hypothetical protein